MSAALKDDQAADLARYMSALGHAARQAAGELAYAEPQQKNQALLAIAEVLDQRREFILQENTGDLEAAGKDGLATAMIDRLELDHGRVDAMIEGLQQVAALADPVGEISELSYRRPNVTIDAAALCLKSGNASILRGGKEALQSNQAIYSCIQQGLQQAGMIDTAVQVINTTDREAVAQMLQMQDSIDVIIPRGGKSLIERISGESRIPVIKHLDGICHVYIDAAADQQKALDIALNSKTRRYGVCNAMETLLLSSSIATELLPQIVAAMVTHGVELRGCERSCQIDSEQIGPAADSDWYAEYLAPILSIRIVDGLQQAIEHINHYGSKHTDAIVTENLSHAREFLRRVDSSSVIVNASTGFADGFEYGLGAEIGISTDKLHTRGPVGLQGLTSQKYVVFGDGNLRS
jgi:glutamate-5-semialdehyde dehydrogenase